MHVDRLFLRRAAWPEQRVDQPGQPVGLADDDVGVLSQLVADQLPVEQLRGAAQAAERILDLVGELANHLPSGTVLDEQRILAIDARPPGDVVQFDENPGFFGFCLDLRDAGLDCALFRVDLGPAEPHLAGVSHTGFTGAAQYIEKLRIVAGQLEQ